MKNKNAKQKKNHHKDTDCLNKFALQTDTQNMKNKPYYQQYNNNRPWGHWFSFELYQLGYCLFPSYIGIIMLGYHIHDNSTFLTVWAETDWIILNIIITLVYWGNKRWLSITLVLVGISVDFFSVIYFLCLQQYDNISTSVLFSLGLPIVLIIFSLPWFHMADHA